MSNKPSKPSGLGDERSLHMKRLKAANAPQKITDASVSIQQLNVARSNLPVKNKRSTATLSKHMKSKIPSPVNVKPSQASTQGNFQVVIKNDKRVPSPTTIASTKTSAMKDHHHHHHHHHQESVETMSQSKVTKKDVTKNKIKNDDHNDQKDNKEKKVENMEVPPASNTNGKTVESTTVQSVENNDKPKDDSVAMKISEFSENTNSPEVTKPTEINEQEAIIGEADKKESTIPLHDETPKLEVNESIEKMEEERQLIIEVSEIIEITDERPSGSNVVESTTSESPTKNPDSAEKLADEGQLNDSFISFDANIMLKDVKIKLNDCLKENTKVLDVADPNASMSDAMKDLSFGRTLRGISGRNSLSRLRNVTVRERRASPNDSLFVNTSSTSFALDKSRFTPEGSPYHNGSQLERKRKITIDETPSKKIKTDQGYSLLNTSLEYLKNLRRPVQVSTPNVREYKYDFEKKNLSDEQTTTTKPEVTVEQKKWCIVM